MEEKNKIISIKKFTKGKITKGKIQKREVVVLIIIMIVITNAIKVIPSSLLFFDLSNIFTRNPPSLFIIFSYNILYIF